MLYAFYLLLLLNGTTPFPLHHRRKKMNLKKQNTVFLLFLLFVFTQLLLSPAGGINVGSLIEFSFPCMDASAAVVTDPTEPQVKALLDLALLSSVSEGTIVSSSLDLQLESVLRALLLLQKQYKRSQSLSLQLVFTDVLDDILAPMSKRALQLSCFVKQQSDAQKVYSGANILTAWRRPTVPTEIKHSRSQTQLGTLPTLHTPVGYRFHKYNALAFLKLYDLLGRTAHHLRHANSHSPYTKETAAFISRCHHDETKLYANQPTAHEKWDYSQQGRDWIPKFCPSGITSRQSPIKIASKDVVQSSSQNIQLHFTQDPRFYKVENNGHSIQISAVDLQDKENQEPNTSNANSDGFGWVHANGKDYHVVQMHFHAPAEHVFAEETDRRSLELHIVTKHTDTDLLVVGVTFVPSSKGKENSFLNAILTHHSFPPPESAYYTVDTNLYDQHLNVHSLFEDSNSLSFYSYAGSLTTPPCSEIVTWYVLKEPIEASPSLLEQLRVLFHYPNSKGNYRELQNIKNQNNNPTVYSVKGFL